MSRVNLQRMGRQDAKNPWNELSSSILMLFINFLITDVLLLISATLAQIRTTQKHTKWFLFGVMKMFWTQIATVWHNLVQFSSVAQSCPTLCNPMDPSTPGLPSITNSRSLLKLMFIESVMPSNQPSSVVLFSSCLQAYPASGTFQMSQFFTLGGQSIGVSTSASVLPMNTQDRCPLR